MLGNLFDYRRKRSGAGAVGFYFVHFAIVLLIMMAMGPFIQPDGMTEARLMELVEEYQQSQEMPEQLAEYIAHISFYSAVLAVLSGAFLSVMVATKKGIFKQPKILVVVLLAIGLCYLAGPLIGFIPIAWMTTKEPEDDDGGSDKSLDGADEGDNNT